VDFFFGDSRVFGGFGDFVVVLGDFTFFGDSRVVFGDLGLATFAAFAFFGEVASFFGLEGAFLVGDVVVVVEAFLVAVFFVPTFFVDLGDLDPVVPAFFEVDVDLFLDVVLTVDEEGAVVEVPEDGAVVEAFLVDFFFFLSFLRPGASLYEALTFTNNVPSFLFKDIFTCFLACSGSTL